MNPPVLADAPAAALAGHRRRRTTAVRSAARRLGRSPWARSPWVPLCSLLVQQVLHRSGASPWFGFPFHVLATAWVALVTVHARHRVSRIGGWLVFVGSAMNAVIIAASGARMPVDPSAWAQVHDGPLLNKERMHVFVTGGWRFPLSDHLAVRSLGVVVSPGDVVLIAGFVLVLTGLFLGRRATRRGDRSSASSAVGRRFDRSAP